MVSTLTVEITLIESHNGASETKQVLNKQQRIKGIVAYDLLIDVDHFPDPYFSYSGEILQFKTCL